MGALEPVVTSHLDSATELLGQFRFGEALAACSAAAVIVERSPTGVDPVVRWRLAHLEADALDELGQTDAAAERADFAAAVAETHRLEHCWARSVGKRIWIARQHGDARLAASRLRQLAHRLSPNSHVLCAVLGSTLSWLGRPETALYYARRCLTLPTEQLDRHRDHRDLARVLMRLGHLDEARQELDRATAALAARRATLAEHYMVQYAEYHLALAHGDAGRAERMAVEATHAVSDPANLRYHLGLLSIARAQRDGGRLDAAADTMRAVEWRRLGAEHRALALRIEASVAERQGDWRSAAESLAEARKILAARHLALPTVLLIEAELAVADPSTGQVAPGAQRTTEFNRAVADRDQLLMAAAKDLRGPMAVFELGAALLDDAVNASGGTRPDSADMETAGTHAGDTGPLDTGKVAALVERGLAEMQLLVDQLRHAEALTAPEPRDRRDPVDGNRIRFGPALDRAVPAVGPVARARQLTFNRIDAAGGAETVGTAADELLERALATLLALAARAASPGSVIDVDGGGGGDHVEIRFTVGGAAAGDDAMQAVTAPTAGGPTSWRLAAALLADRGATIGAEWAAPGRVLLTVACASTRSAR